MEGGKHQVAGKRSLNGRLGSLQISNLADHDDVWVMSKDGPKTCGEGHIRRGIHLNLVHTLDVVLHGIFNGDRLHGFAHDAIERGIERGGFARTGRSSDQEDPVRAGDHRVPSLGDLGGHAEIIEFELRHAVIENPKDDAFAGDHWNDRDSKVEFSTLVPEGDPAVLRLPLFRNVQPGHDLEATDDGISESVHRCGDAGLAEHAIDPIANGELFLVGLDVNIRGSLSNRFEEEIVDQLDDAGLLVGVEFSAGGIEDEIRVGRVVIGQGIKRVSRDAVMRSDEFPKIALVGQDEFDSESGEEP